MVHLTEIIISMQQDGIKKLYTLNEAWVNVC